MAVNHLPNQVLFAGDSKGPIIFSLAFGMAWCANSHWANEKQLHWPNEVLLARKCFGVPVY